MLAILRTQRAGENASDYMNATIVLRENEQPIVDCPDLTFLISTYQKVGVNKKITVTDNEDGSVASSSVDDEITIGDRILMPANMFFDTLSLKDQKALYAMYKESARIIGDLTIDNLREIQELLQDVIFKTIWGTKLDEKTVAFTSNDPFVYACDKLPGDKPHYTAEKTFLEHDYKEITAISILAKIMIPIWGSFIARLKVVGIDSMQWEQCAFSFVEPVLDEGAYERIYAKMSNFFRSIVAIIRERADNNPNNTASTSFILTRTGVDDYMFENMIMGAIVVKRLAIWDCFEVPGSGSGAPDVMVYIYDGVWRAVDAKIKGLREQMKTLPKRDLQNHDTDDNSSIIDHISRTSSKSIDVPILVAVAVENWEIDRMLKEMDIPLPVFNAAVTFYRTNGFGVSPLTQALLSSFIGTRFGGSKCINYLPPHLYEKIVVILQIFLIRNDLVQLAALTSSITSEEPIEGVGSTLAMWIKSNYLSAEYDRCKDIFKGYLEKPVQAFTKKPGRQKAPAPDRIDFPNHITKMIDWIINHSHSENMAPSLWDFAQQEHHPIHGTECQFDQYIIQQLCRFYLLFHEPKPSGFNMAKLVA